MIIEKVCPRCDTAFSEDVKRGYGKTYCSRRCANTREHSEATRLKISTTASDNWAFLTESQRQNAVENLAIGRVTRHTKCAEKLLILPTESLSHTARKKKVFAEQNKRCNECGISDWNGKPLTFELEHRDGNKHNNLRDNLEVLCPNCHSQTSTWRGRNNKRV